MTAKIKLNSASGGGSFSLQAPSSSSNNRVITLPDVADGTLLTTQSTGLGKIIQVVQVAPSTGSSTDFDTTNTSAQHITALDTSITPIAANSKLFVMMNLRTQNDHGSDANGRQSVSMARSIGGGSLSSTILQGFNGIYGFSGSSRNNYLNHTGTLLDTPSYTLGQAIVYKFYLASDTANNTARVYLSSSNGPRSAVTVMEIAA